MALINPKDLKNQELQKLLQSLQSEIRSREGKTRKQIRQDLEKKLKAAGLTIFDVYPEFAGKAATKGKRGRPAKLLQFPRKPRADSGKRVEPKFRHPQSGETWTGRGRPKQWVMDVCKKHGLNVNDFKKPSEYKI